MEKMSWLSLQIFLLLGLIAFGNCKSPEQMHRQKKDMIQLQSQIEFHVKCLNDGNKEGLSSIYSDHYEGISPVTKFSNKSELISQLIDNQKKQNITIEIEIIEIIPSKEMAFAVLDWKAITNAGTANEQLLYDKKHLQIWERVKKDWQLKRSLFYN